MSRIMKSFILLYLEGGKLVEGQSQNQRGQKTVNIHQQTLKHHIWTSQRPEDKTSEHSHNYVF